jgi:hypothetical protein
VPGTAGNRGRLGALDARDLKALGLARGPAHGLVGARQGAAAEADARHGPPDRAAIRDEDVAVDRGDPRVVRHADMDVARRHLLLAREQGRPDDGQEPAERDPGAGDPGAAKKALPRDPLLVEFRQTLALGGSLPAPRDLLSQASVNRLHHHAPCLATTHRLDLPNARC